MGNRGLSAPASDPSEAMTACTSASTPAAASLFKEPKPSGGAQEEEEEDEEERWEVLAELTPGVAAYVEVPLDASGDAGSGVLREGPCLGLAATPSAERPDITFAVASGWLLRDSSMGPMRCEALEDLGRSGEVFCTAGVWVDAMGRAAFYRRPGDDEPWQCSGEIDLDLFGSPPARVLARRAGGAVLLGHGLEPTSPEPPRPPKKRMQVHWRGTAPTPWFERAVRRKDLPRLEASLLAGVAVSAKDARLEGGLHHCARRFWPEGLKALLGARVDANALSVFKRTPLIEACLVGDVESLKLLLEARADPDVQGGVAWEQRACALVKTKECRSALHHAAAQARPDLLSALLDAHAAVDRLDARGATALKLATQADSVQRAAAAAILLAARANPNPPIDPRQRVHITPLHTAAHWGDWELVTQLLDAAAEPDRGFSATTLSPLMVAAKGRSGSHTKVVSALLGARASAAAATAQGRTALSLAKLNKATAEAVAALEAAAAASADAGAAAPDSSALADTAAASERPVLAVDTELGRIALRLRPDAAPRTVEHVKSLVGDGLYDGCCFYRSDIVLQFGLQRPDGSRVENPHPPLAANETACNMVLSNLRGTMALAHWDIPDCGNAELFINLQDNQDLDTSGGGYCVFAEVDGAASMGVVDALAAAALEGRKPGIAGARLQ